MSTVVVHITRSDLLSLTFRWLTGWRQVWRPFLFMFVVVAALGSYRHGIPDTGWSWLALLLVAIGVGIVAILAGLLFALLSVILHARKMPGLLGIHEYTFVPDGLMEKTDANETLIKWAGAHSLVRTDSFIQINVAPGLAHVIPRRAFDEPAAFDAFCSKASRLVRPQARRTGKPDR